MQGYSSLIATDDYSIQNVADKIGIKYVSLIQNVFNEQRSGLRRKTHKQYLISLVMPSINMEADLANPFFAIPKKRIFACPIHGSKLDNHRISQF